jgi:hypothetical protein
MQIVITLYKLNTEREGRFEGRDRIGLYQHLENITNFGILNQSEVSEKKGILAGI